MHVIKAVSPYPLPHITAQPSLLHYLLLWRQNAPQQTAPRSNEQRLPAAARSSVGLAVELQWNIAGGRRCCNGESLACRCRDRAIMEHRRWSSLLQWRISCMQVPQWSCNGTSSESSLGRRRRGGAAMEHCRSRRCCNGTSLGRRRHGELQWNIVGVIAAAMECR